MRNVEMGRTYFIGDQHGCADEFETLMLGLIGSGELGKSDHVVLMGDLWSRGPHYARMIDAVQTIREQGIRVSAIRGNHDVIHRWEDLTAEDGHKHILQAQLAAGEEIEELRKFLDSSYTHAEMLESPDTKGARKVFAAHAMVDLTVAPWQQPPDLLMGSFDAAVQHYEKVTGKKHEEGERLDLSFWHDTTQWRDDLAIHPGWENVQIVIAHNNYNIGHDYVHTAKSGTPYLKQLEPVTTKSGRQGTGPTVVGIDQNPDWGGALTAACYDPEEGWSFVQSRPPRVKDRAAIDNTPIQEPRDWRASVVEQWVAEGALEVDTTLVRRHARRNSTGTGWEYTMGSEEELRSSWDNNRISYGKESGRAMAGTPVGPSNHFQFTFRLDALLVEEETLHLGAKPITRKPDYTKLWRGAGKTTTRHTAIPQRQSSRAISEAN